MIQSKLFGWILVFGLLNSFASGMIARAGQVEFKFVTELVGKSKMWLPSVLIVKKGDRVKIQAANNIPGPRTDTHGLEIKEFNIKEEVGAGGKTITFVADKAGVFTIGCHLHPAHIGGQLLVLE